MWLDLWTRKKTGPGAPILEAVTVKVATASNSAVINTRGSAPGADRASLTMSSSARALPQLGEKELLALYKVSKVCKLEAGQVLYRESDPADYFYLVTKGEIHLLHHAPGTKEVDQERVRKGDWVTDVNLSNPGPRNGKAIANLASAVMIIDNEVLAQLDDRIKLALFAKVHHVNTRRIRKLNDEKVQVRRRNTQLVDGLISASHKYDPDIAGSELIQNVIKNIPRLPVSTSDLLGKLMNQRSTTQEVVELVKQDPSLTASLLKTINSPCFAFQQSISDMNHAVMLLGYDGVYSMAMASGIRNCLPDTEVFHDMYERSLSVSKIAFALSQESRIGQPAGLATIGLLHQIGMTVTAMLKQHYPNMVPLIMYLEDTDMGAALLRAWNIPESVCKTIGLQKYPEFAPPKEIDQEVLQNVAVLYFSQLCYRMLVDGETTDLPVLFLEEYLDVMGWSEESLDSILHTILKPKLRRHRKGLPQRLLAQLGEE